MSAELLTSIAGVGLSLACSYVPGVAGRYAALDGASKRLVMLALLLLTTGGIFAVGCTTWGPALGVNVACDQPGAAGLARAFIMALVANQGTYLISPVVG